MSYEVTATRKRPRDFETLAGQEFVVSTLKNSISTGRIAHAYLFSGPRGVGKTSSARILARALNCIKGPTATPCGECSNCLEIQHGNNVDVIEIDGASNTSVNDIREIKEEVLFAPNSSKYKIYIIDEVHMLSNSAFNALLKTIEEPPPYIIFIFATTEIHKVPATIRSRCQQFNFRLIPSETIKNLLCDIVKESSIKAEDDALFWIAKEATGSLRDAYTLFDQVVAFSDNDITLDKIKSKLGLVGLDQVNQISEYFITGDRKNALLELDKILSQGLSAEQFIIDLTEYFRSLLLIKTGITRESLLGYKKERFNSNIIENLSLTQLEAGINYLLSLYRDIRFSLNQRFELELLVSKMCGLTEFFSHKELLNQILTLKNKLGGDSTIINPQKNKINFNSPKETNYTQKTPPILQNSIIEPMTAEEKTVTNNNTIQNENLTNEQKSQLLLEKLDCHHHPSLCSSINQATKWEFDQNKITIYFTESFHLDIVEQNSEILQKCAELAFNKSLVIRLSKQVQEKVDIPDDEKNNNVDMVLNIFKGQVIN